MLVTGSVSGVFLSVRALQQHGSLSNNKSKTRMNKAKRQAYSKYFKDEAPDGCVSKDCMMMMLLLLMLMMLMILFDDNSDDDDNE